MLRDYRAWLESELKLLGNASHHAYSFGQANMAKRALDRLDQEFAENIALEMDRGEAMRVLTALEHIFERTTSLDPALAHLRERISSALAESMPGGDTPEPLRGPFEGATEPPNTTSDF